MDGVFELLHSSSRATESEVLNGFFGICWGLENKTVSGLSTVPKICSRSFHKKFLNI